jgi:hypothetical protein
VGSAGSNGGAPAHGKSNLIHTCLCSLAYACLCNCFGKLMSWDEAS